MTFSDVKLDPMLLVVTLNQGREWEPSNPTSFWALNTKILYRETICADIETRNKLDIPHSHAQSPSHCPFAYYEMFGKKKSVWTRKATWLNRRSLHWHWNSLGIETQYSLNVNEEKIDVDSNCLQSWSNWFCVSPDNIFWRNIIQIDIFNLLLLFKLRPRIGLGLFVPFQ